jgi:hypothetical protein
MSTNDRFWRPDAPSPRGGRKRWEWLPARALQDVSRRQDGHALNISCFDARLLPFGRYSESGVTCSYLIRELFKTFPCPGSAFVASEMVDGSG